VELRTLRRGERELVLDLLDGWELPDGWQGRDFFRRYLEDDPTFADENVWVAVDGGRPVSCVQIFPRPLRIRGEAVPAGGIGSVFTLPDYRRGGVAGALLARSVEAMAGSGFEISLLFAARIAWYTYLGWRSWVVSRTVLERGDRAPREAGAQILPFDPGRDLAAVKAIYEEYSGSLEGTVVRDESLWTASLANAGNPEEDFLIARVGRETLAYARATVLEDFPVITEFGHGAGGVQALVDLLAAMVGERALAGNLHLDPDLERALDDRGLIRHSVQDSTVMLRCIAAAALAGRLGVEPPDPGNSESFLEAVLPAGSFGFWTADRF
jgi:GNAT superfamily N-acetyltransferase